jgi:hypothetical protein
MPFSYDDIKPSKRQEFEMSTCTGMRGEHVFFMEKIFTLPEVTIRLRVETSYFSEM